MSNKNLADIVLLMEPNVNSMSETARDMLCSLKNIDNEVIDMYGEPVLFFLEGFIQTVLDWMGTGEVEQIRNLLEQMHKILRDESEDAHFIHSLSPNIQLTIKLQDLGQFMAVFLRTNNLSRYLGILSGRRRASWCNALRCIYKYNHPVRTSDLIKEGIFRSDSTANNALNQLAAIGLLEKHKKDSQAAIYELTWEGRSVCKALKSYDSIKTISKPRSEYNITFAYILPDLMEKYRKVQDRVRRSPWRES